jgi:hypothetical protein
VIENIYILIRICFKYVVGLKLAGWDQWEKKTKGVSSDHGKH